MRFGKIVYKVSGRNGIARVRSERRADGKDSIYQVECNNGAYGGIKNTAYVPVGRMTNDLEDAKRQANGYAN